MMGLTPQQAQLLAFLRQRHDQGAIMPSIQEMIDHLGLSSKSAGVRLLKALEERGHIRRLPNRNRAIALVDANPLARFTSTELRAELDRRAISAPPMPAAKAM
ncbi:MAG: MarR family transcriptional regulator [Sphingomonadales bacterium]|jgi:repressor LexA